MKKTVSCLLALIMLLSCFSMSAYANEAVPEYITVDSIDAINFSPEILLEIPNTEKDEFDTNKFLGNIETPDTPYLFYNQLTDTQKIIYDAFINAGVAASIKLPFDYPTNPIVGSGASNDEALANAKAVLSNDIAAALSAACEDNPMYYWVNGFAYGFSYYKGSSGSVYYVYVCNITLTINIDTNSYTDFADVQAKYDALLEAVENFEVNGINRYEKLKSINDKLCYMVTYPKQQGSFGDGTPWYGPMVHQPTGALLNGSAVCEGYAEALKLICDRERIPCITAVGTGNGRAHKWNYVKMDDGLWYMIDTTWNDQVTNKYYDWFLIGSDFDSGDHVNLGKLYDNVDFTLNYPKLSTDNYSMAVLARNAPDISFVNTNNVIYVGKGVTNYLSFINLPSNISSSVSGSSVTGARLTLRNSNTSVTRIYTVAMRGDVNASNTVTSADTDILRQAANANYKLQSGTANYYAADMNGDGAVDAYDAIAHDLYVNDMLKYN